MGWKEGEGGGEETRGLFHLGRGWSSDASSLPSPSPSFAIEIGSKRGGGAAIEGAVLSMQRSPCVRRTAGETRP